MWLPSGAQHINPSPTGTTTADLEAQTLPSAKKNSQQDGLSGDQGRSVDRLQVVDGVEVGRIDGQSSSYVSERDGPGAGDERGWVRAFLHLAPPGRSP